MVAARKRKAVYWDLEWTMLQQGFDYAHDKDSLGERLGLRGGDRSATLEGQPHVLGGDIILAAQGIELGTIDDLIRASKAIRDQPPGREVRMRVLRAGKIVELTTIWSGGAN
jgi:S1-C subfamily serine protease